MSDDQIHKLVDVAAWVDRAKEDPVTHLQRQAAEITLHTIAMTSPLNKSLVLKGGLLMGLAYDSPRQTSDIDLTAALAAEPEIDQKLAKTLDDAFPAVSAKLGYTDIVIKTHSVRKMPKPATFDVASFPALKMKIAFALRGSPDENAMRKGKGISTIFEIDISFNEFMQQTQILSLSGEADLLAYDLADLIAEKYRAMLQQVERKRNRRQDVFDLNILIHHESIRSVNPQNILNSFLEKSRSRNIEPSINSLDNPEVRERSRKNWNTIALEVVELPEFDPTYDAVHAFYRRLPWDKL